MPTWDRCTWCGGNLYEDEELHKTIKICLLCARIYDIIGGKLVARQNPCPIPGCSRNISVTSKYGVCATHNDQFEGITYYLKQLQKQQTAKTKKTPGGLYLP